MPHPLPNHLYTVKNELGEFHGNFSWTQGPPKTYQLFGSDNELICEGELQGDPPVFTLLNQQSSYAGVVNCSPSPDGAAVSCVTYPDGQVKTLHY